MHLELAEVPILRHEVVYNRSVIECSSYAYHAIINLTLLHLIKENITYEASDELKTTEFLHRG